MAITTSNCPARCLDVTRLVSRVGRGQPTGIDRVEMAYLLWLLRDQAPLFVMARLGGFFFVLDQAGVGVFLRRLRGRDPWGSADWKSAIHRRLPPEKRQVLTDLRKLSIGRARDRGLGRLLRRVLPKQTRYLNVGHSNLSETVLRSVKSVAGARIAILIHDVIPLDFPQFQRPGATDEFRHKIDLVARHADLVIFNSQHSKKSAEPYLAIFGPLPKSVVAHLGVEVATPCVQDLPPGIDLGEPYFVTVGTIEPRKNHALLLDIWSEFAQQPRPPKLYVVGNRGWENQATFEQLDASPRGLVELNSLTDGAVSALVQNAAGFLFPSLVEGFGLPPAEAAALKTPVLCSDLDVYKEVLGDYPVYVDADDSYLWKSTITMLASKKARQSSRAQAAQASISLPTWEDHFNLVLNLI